MLVSFLLTLYFASCSALYPVNSDVVVLTPHNFDELVLNSDEVWMVEFFAAWCENCRQLVPAYLDTAEVLKGVVKVGAVDGVKDEILASRFWLKGFPTVKIFGANKYKPEEIEGYKNTEILVQAALDAVNAMITERLGGKSEASKTDVIELTASTFDKLVIQSDDMWMVEFYAPWSGNCQNIAPHWAEAATSLKGKVKMGALDMTVYHAVAAAFQIQEYPTVKYFPAGRKKPNVGITYDGEFTKFAIVEWALRRFTDNIQTAKISQIVNRQSFKETCKDKALCVLAFLPRLIDCQSKCRKAYLKIIRKLARQYKNKLWGWGWVEAGAQPDLENALDIGGSGYPAMAAVNPKKLKYSILRGSFSDTGIDDFLMDVDYGRSSTDYVKGHELPKIVKTELWHSKD